MALCVSVTRGSSGPGDEWNLSVHELTVRHFVGIEALMLKTR